MHINIHTYTYSYEHSHLHQHIDTTMMTMSLSTTTTTSTTTSVAAQHHSISVSAVNICSPTCFHNFWLFCVHSGNMIVEYSSQFTLFLPFPLLFSYLFLSHVFFTIDAMVCLMQLFPPAYTLVLIFFWFLWKCVMCHTPKRKRSIIFRSRLSPKMCGYVCFVCIYVYV